MTGQFAQVPAFVIVADVGPLATKLYAVMALGCDYRARTLTTTHAELAERLGASVASVKRALGELGDIGAVVVTARRHGRRQAANRYELPMEPAQELTGELLTDEPLESAACSSPVSYQPSEEDPDAACGEAVVDEDEGVGSAPPLPLELPEEGVVDVVAEACMVAAVASAKRERQGGKKITVLSRYAAPRAKDWEAEHGDDLRRLAAEGAGQAALVGWLEEHAYDPTRVPRAVEERRPALQEFGVQGEFEEPDAGEVLDLEGRRRAARAGADEARAMLRRQRA